MLKGKKGTTLVELISAIAILGIILAPISLIMTRGYSSYLTESDTMLAQDKARELMDSIIKDLRENDSTDIDIKLDETGKSYLYIKDGFTYKFTTVPEKKLTRTNGGNITVYTDITDFKVSMTTEGYDGNIINIELSVSYKNGRSITFTSSYRIKSENV